MPKRINRNTIGHHELIGVSRDMEERQRELIKIGRTEPPKKPEFNENSKLDRSKLTYKMAQAGAPVIKLSPLTRAKILLRAALEKKK